MSENKNAIKWPLMIEAIYNSMKTGDHSGDATTRRVMNKIVSWLVKGKKLSPNLRKALLLNIEQRTSYVLADAPEEIRLTENQLKHLRRTRPEWVAIANGDDGEDMDESALNGAIVSTSIQPTGEHLSTSFQRLFNALSTSIQRSFNDLSTVDPVAALALAQDLVVEAQKSVTLATRSSQTNSPILSKEEIMEEMKRNHGRNMISAIAATHENQESIHESSSPGIARESQESIHESIQDSMIHVPAHQGSPIDSCNSSNPSDVIKCFHEPIDSPPISEHEEGLGQRETAPARHLSIWVKEQKGKMVVSGNYEIGNESYKMVFKTFDATLEKLNIEGADNQAFRTTLNQEIYPFYRNITPTGDLRDNFQMSAIYGPRDYNAYRDPIACEMAVGLEWDESNQITAVHHIADGKITRHQVKKYNGGLYKSTIR